MRPAHSAREILQIEIKRPGIDVASMRPAHSAREIAMLTSTSSPSHGGFNEARAFSAGNHGHWHFGCHRQCSFNEARAFSAGNLPRCAACVAAIRSRFNEARAFSAGNRGRWLGQTGRRRCFNEARAFSAGNRRRYLIRLRVSPGFNEARAFSAGNHGVSGEQGVGPGVASMRPAHSAREISNGCKPITRLG